MSAGELLPRLPWLSSSWHGVEVSSLAGAATGGAALACLVPADPSPGAGRAPPSPGLHLLVRTWEGSAPVIALPSG